MAVDPVRSPVHEVSMPTPAVPAVLQPDGEVTPFVDQLRAKLSENKIGENKIGENKIGRGATTSNRDDSELHKAFNDFVGQTLFGRLIASMRATQNEPAYMHGGQAEKIFQNQFDQVLAEEMTQASADTIADPMYELFRASRSS
jgi:hypothetical protein